VYAVAEGVADFIACEQVEKRCLILNIWRRKKMKLEAIDTKKGTFLMQRSKR
jgi:hypothetical protein